MCLYLNYICGFTNHRKYKSVKRRQFKKQKRRLHKKSKYHVYNKVDDYDVESWGQFVDIES